MKTLRWGVLSTAKIGIKKVIPAIQQAENCTVTGICSRNFNKAQKTADKLKIQKAYGSYEDLLNDSKIDAIYNPLPNHLHVPWTIKALEAGKHVLCEKPIGLDTKEAKTLLEATHNFPHLKVMEAFMYRHHPQWLKAKKIVTSGKIGELCTINSFFSYFNDDGDNIRNKADIGGGSLMDIGCYPVSLSRFIFNEEPLKVVSSIERDPDFEIDRLTSAIMEFNNGTSTFTCSTQLSPYQRVLIYGTKGHIEIEIPFNAPPDEPCRLWKTINDKKVEITFDVCDQYTLQAELFALAVLNNSPVPTPLTDAVANMKVIDAIFKSGATSSWVQIG